MTKRIILNQLFLWIFLSSCFKEETSHIKIEPESLGISTAKLNILIEEVNDLVDNGQIPGVQTALLKNGKLVSFHTYGFSDIESRKVLADNSIFRIYSMTKPIVSIGLMMLYEKGAFELDDNVSKYIPQFNNLVVYDSLKHAKPKNSIKIIDLLRHSSGIGYGWSNNQYLNSMYSELWKSKNNEEFVDGVSKIPLFSNPNNLVVKFAQDKGAVAIIRGLRHVSDFELEFQIANVNHGINSEVSTILMVSNEKFLHLNSSIIRELAEYNTDLSKFVPKNVEERLMKKLKGL